MNMERIAEAKEHFAQICKLCDTLEEVGLWKSPDEDISLKSILRVDIAKFIMYLSSADGSLSHEEVMAYRFITQYGDDVDSIYEMIKNNNIYSTEFESTVPFSLEIITECEQKYVSIMGNSNPDRIPVPELYVNLFEHIGHVIISIEGGVTYTERRDLGIYLDTLRGYVRENDTKSICGFEDSYIDF